METCEVLGRIGELINEEYELYNRAGNRGLRAREHELLRRLEVNPGSMLEPPQAAPDAQRGRLRLERGEGKGREPCRRLLAITPQPAGCGAPGRSLD